MDVSAFFDYFGAIIVEVIDSFQQLQLLGTVDLDQSVHFSLAHRVSHLLQLFILRLH